MKLEFIAVATDFSAGSRYAVDRAIRLAAEHRATLQLLCTTQAMPSNHVAQQLAHLAHECKTRFGIRAWVVERPATTPAMIASATLHADLLLLAETRRAGVSAMFGNSMAQELARACRCPTLVVRSAPKQAYQRILTAVDLSAPVDPSIEVACGMSRGATVEVFHPIPPFRRNPMRDAEVPEHIMTNYMQSRRLDALRQLRHRAGTTDASDRIVIAIDDGEFTRRTAERQRITGADLVVVGRPRRMRVWDLVRSSIADHVLKRCQSDVLLVPFGRPASPSRLGNAARSQEAAAAQSW